MGTFKVTDHKTRRHISNCATLAGQMGPKQDHIVREASKATVTQIQACLI